LFIVLNLIELKNGIILMMSEPGAYCVAQSLWGDATIKKMAGQIIVQRLY